MNDSLIRKFCESRRRWLIVATASGLLGLVALLPMVDDYFDKRSSHSELSEKLAAARLTAETLPKLEKQATAVRVELDSLEVRTVDDANLARFRSELVDQVRDAGCQIRRLEVGSTTRRPWKENDDPLLEVSVPGGADTAFALERRSVVLSVDGNAAAIQDLLARLEQERKLSHPHRLQLQAASNGGDAVTVELELWLFTLARNAS
jgi:hypothetical protein